MAKTTFQHISDDDFQRDSIQYQINQGTMTNAKYQTLTPDQQEVVKEVLFDMYSKDALNVYTSMSGLEFLSVSLGKLLFQLIPASGTTMSSGTLAFYNQVQDIVNQHPLPVQSGTWELSYLQNQMQTVLQNRSDYQTAKQGITGSF